MAGTPTGRRRERSEDRHEASLRPIRWYGRPRTSVVVRAALVAALLTTAAGILYAHEPQTCSAEPAGAVVASPPPVGASGAPLSIPSGLVGVPIRLTEPAALAALRPGERVDLLAVHAGAPSVDRTARNDPSVLAPSALVLDVLDGDGEVPSALLLALAPEQARRAVALPDTTRFAVILR